MGRIFLHSNDTISSFSVPSSSTKPSCEQEGAKIGESHGFHAGNPNKNCSYIGSALRGICHIMLRTPDASRLLAESTTPHAHLRTPLTHFTRPSQAQGRSLSVGQGRQATSRALGRPAHRAQRVSAIAAPEAPTQDKCASQRTCLIQPYCCFHHEQALSLPVLAGNQGVSSWLTLVSSDWLSWDRYGVALCSETETLSMVYPDH